MAQITHRCPYCLLFREQRLYLPLADLKVHLKDEHDFDFDAACRPLGAWGHVVPRDTAHLAHVVRPHGPARHGATWCPGDRRFDD